MGQLILILGGARSGKSGYAARRAVELAGLEGNVLYVATAQPLDDEMARRIARHRAARPPAWRTLEEPLDLAATYATACTGEREGTESTVGSGGPSVVVVDCITLWLSNLLGAQARDGAATPDEDTAQAAAQVEVDRLLLAHRGSGASTILVSNEVGMGLVPPYPLGRLYRDLLGRVNTWLAAEADEVVLLVAGVPLRVKSRTAPA